MAAEQVIVQFSHIIQEHEGPLCNRRQSLLFVCCWGIETCRKHDADHGADRLFLENRARGTRASSLR